MWEEAAYDPKSETWELAFQDGYESPEDGDVFLRAEVPYLIEVGCWDGQGGGYALNVSYLEFVSGDDDDSAGDDDDSAGDDDDSSGDDDDSAPTVPTWTDVYFNVISANCSCHISGAGGWAFNGLQTTAYNVLVGVSSNQSSLARIEPGSAEASYLQHKLDGTQGTVGGSGQQMPRNSPALPESLRDMVRAWIDAGALDN
ncbi:MAG: hypothetical protein VX498_09225 [Myxococcota bacterium]|nr:hypothetical protein [Myxococcota bacterium]